MVVRIDRKITETHIKIWFKIRLKWESDFMLQILIKSRQDFDGDDL